MSCIKTGCVAYLADYGEWIYGDAFDHNGVLVVRTVFRTRDAKDLEEFGDVRNFTIHRTAHWWDEKATSMKQNSTVISERGNWHQDGDYEGIPEPLLKKTENAD